MSSDDQFAKFETHLKKAGKDFRTAVELRFELRARSLEYEGGIKSGSFEASGGNGGHSDPTADRVVHPDELPFQWYELNREAKRLAERAATLRALVESALTVRQDAARKAVEKSGRIACANPNCGKVVAGTPEDRLRGERCVPCYQYLWRTGKDRPWGLIHRESQVTK